MKKLAVILLVVACGDVYAGWFTKEDDKKFSGSDEDINKLLIMQSNEMNADKKMTRFTYHDLKAKGVSDFEGDKQAASGHKTASMVAVYDRKKKKVKATK